MIRVRTTTGSDWEALRDLRLEALADSPGAFRSTHAGEARRSDDEWRTMATTTAQRPDEESFVLEVDGTPDGLAYAWVEDERLHIAAMWVRASARGMGGGRRALLSAALAWGAERGAASATLAVTIDNEEAERLYAAAGFTATGETEPLREGSELRVAWMARRL